MGGERDDKIRQRAYQIWEGEGQPAGRDQDHWYRAQAEIGGADRLGEAAAEPPAKRPRRASPTAATETQPQRRPRKPR